MAECEMPHCPDHDAHLVPEILITLGPLHLGLAECPILGCTYSLHIRIFTVEVS